MYLRDGYKCAYSGYVDTTCTGKRLSLDHITPIHLGGALQNKRDEPATNLTTAHAPTNFAKADRTQEQWSAYAAAHQPPKGGLKFDWKDIEKGAQPPPELDMERGKQLSKLAAQARDARRLDKNGKRTIETPKSREIAAKSQKIVAEYQAEQAAKNGPGVRHDPDNGQFVPGDAVARAMSMLARHASATMTGWIVAALHEGAAALHALRGNAGVANLHREIAADARRSGTIPQGGEQ